VSQPAGPPPANALVAAVQMNSGDDPAHNWERMQALGRRARERGATLIAFPENVLYEGPDKGRHHPLEEWEPRFAGLARELGATLVAGSLREPTDDPNRAHNTTLAFGPTGGRLARYRKIHLFDVDVPGGPREHESSYIEPGRDVVVFEAEGLGLVGLVICYDLRFPELFRALTQAGARTIVMPTSFALGTGKDHWLPLLRARAIENQVFLIAPDQHGKKPHGSVKFGKTAVVDPWGTVLGLARDTDEDLVVAELDFAHQDRVRASLPCLQHRVL
jgi:deaminated glutathione amidase